MSDSLSGARLRDLLVQAVLLVLLLIPVFPGVFLRGEMIAPGDILFRSLPWSHYAPPGWTTPQNPLMPDVVTAFHPYYVLTKEAIANGEWPLWNMYELAGMPLLANCQTAAFYPPRLLHAFLDVEVATTLYIILKLLLCGMTAFGCARALRLSMPASRFFSVAWMLASYNVIWCNWSLPDVSVWLPVLFAATEFTLDGRYRKGFILMAIGGALILLAGHPETAFAMSFGLGVYFLVRLLWEWRSGGGLWRPIGVCAAAWTVAILICAAQLLPFIEYLVHSDTLTDRPNWSAQTWLSGGTVASFWVPRFFGTSAERTYWGDTFSNQDSMSYPGMAVWVGVLALFLRNGNRSRHRARIAALIAASLFGAALTYNMYPFDYIHALPMFRSMLRYYHIGFCVFALPLLGAIGLDHWLSQPRKLRELLAPLLGLMIAGAVVAVVYMFDKDLIRAHKFTGYFNTQIARAVVVAAIGLLLLLLHCVFRKSRILPVAWTVFLAVDLLIATRGLNPTIPRRYLYPKTALTDFINAQGHPCRFGLGEGGVASGIMAAYGVEDWLGYDGLYPERMIRFQKTLKREWWDAMEPASSIDYFLNDPRFAPEAPMLDAARFERVTTLDGLEVYKNKRAFPRAYLVGQLANIPDVPSLLDAMRTASFDPGKVVLTERPPSGRLPSATDGRLGGAQITRYSSTRVSVTVDAAQECYLVLADAFYPGWSATIDGKPAEIFPADYAFRGLVVPAGLHTVEYTYNPLSFRIGLAISSTTLILSVILALPYLCLPKRRRDAPVSLP
ncbi:MAG: YfhO family protein [Candidatus Hydrogenedentes bacterium]|nr:YfhO family protein [Candidatus Hydrogenedentota bacterium]